MRRRISLYIDNQLVDLDDDSFILFNYTQEETSSPAVVMNSFSQQITLKGTPSNNKVFGNIYRFDRVTQYGPTFSGVDFDPTRKTPFTIFNEMSEVLESGYVKLDKVSRVGSQYEYTITLFGGLGSFFYALTYDEQGNKRTLADLDFLGTETPEDEFNFTIDKSAVLDAWARINGDTDKDALWDVLNFAPAYNGLPNGTFDADKAIVNADNVGLPTQDGEYSTKNGYTFINLAKKYTEWEVKDLRSYLQRMVIKFSSIIEAICDPANNGGYSVELDPDFFSDDNPYYAGLWMTLPLLNTLNVQIEDGSGTLDFAEDESIVIPDGGNTSTNYIVDFAFVPKITTTTPASEELFMDVMEEYTGGDGRTKEEFYMNWIEYTLTAYDEDDNEIAQTIVKVSSRNGVSPYAPVVDYVNSFDQNGEWQGGEIHAHLEGVGIHHLVLTKDVKSAAWGDYRHEPSIYRVWTNRDSWSDAYSVSSYDTEEGESGATYEYHTNGSPRSGAAITKRMLLSGDKTPADYLLSFCNMFGLRFLSDKANKRISILMRKNLFNGDTMDISNRVDVAKGIDKVPFAFDARWYDFGVPYENGEFVKYYQNIWSKEYGIQRVNTGYGFNADAKQVMENIILTGAAEVLENSKYFMDIIQGNKLKPAVFLDSGATYNLYKGDGEAKEYDVPIPSTIATKTWLNPSYPTYDLFSKAQFHNEDNAGYDERNTLLFFAGMQEMTSERFAVTDDNITMLTLNGNTPCWILENQEEDPSSLVEYMPMFSRYLKTGNAVSKSLDFGIPSEVQIPDITFGADSTIYEQFWKDYISDRYDDDSSVITCYVDWAGMQVNESLFRNFYYFGGAVWSLNRIINHSMTTFDPTQCEFVKVQDINNYQQ